MYITKPKKYNPSSPKNKKILHLSAKILEETPYQPTLRYIFYQLHDMGILQNKQKDYNYYSKLMSTARKRFYQNYTPYCLNDDTRTTLIKSWYQPPEPEQPDLIKQQKNYVEIWFESDTMLSQIEYITKKYQVTLVSFKGDASVKHKWNIAERLTFAKEKYPDKPIIILYCGDCDTKGKQIPKSAMKDINSWTPKVNIDFKIIGLTLEQAQKYELPLKYEDNETFQWVSLHYKHAEDLILNELEKYWKKPKH
jgi:hypothetical protein